jgi:hypothetical protein
MSIHPTELEYVLLSQGWLDIQEVSSFPGNPKIRSELEKRMHILTITLDFFDRAPLSSAWWSGGKRREKPQ